MKQVTMTTHRKKSGKQRAQKEDAPTYNIRFDYSDTYLDNADLKNRLEDQADELHREKYRWCVESEEILKKTKQDADEMLQLKNAIKNRDPYESSNRVMKSADLKRKGSSKQLNLNTTTNTEYNTEVTQNVAKDVDKDVPDAKSERELDETDSAAPEILEDTETKNEEKTLQSKPLNTLTMFLLSLQTFRRNGHQRKEELGKKSQSHSQTNLTEHTKPQTEHSQTRKTPGKRLLNMKRPSSYHHGEYDTSEHRQGLGVDKKDDSQYGIHVRKDFTRSRRKLEEISKLEQDTKYGYVDKYEERRKKLLAACKDTKNVDDRIKLFLKDVEEFKTMTSADNSLEKVLLRSKSAHFPRSSSFAW